MNDIDFNEETISFQSDDKVTIGDPDTRSHDGDSNRSSFVALMCISVVFIALVVAIVYKIRFPEFTDPESNNYCNPNLYLTAFWIINYVLK
ncbi:unnamed protein product [Medioppia subpectinata]|uniref:Uncharacterized protein n=1 Tax=Medioppia subpectinata TaxID=1979941 RepID=A0A7R9KEC8_9ACAR|nr:unnamed protein product [Medioppia subpectinata]CAG2100571.1 unnamed protein product [Medioppia subpectinata]